MVRKRNLVILIIILGLILAEMGPPNGEGAQGYGQSAPKKLSSKPEKERDPFGLPPGVKLLAPGMEEREKKEKEKKGEEKKVNQGKIIMELPAQVTQEPETHFPPLKLKAILISEQLRLAAIEDRLVTEGTTIGQEEVLEIKPDRVILGRGAKRRTIYLPQSSVPLMVEER